MEIKKVFLKVVLTLTCAAMLPVTDAKKVEAESSKRIPKQINAGNAAVITSSVDHKASGTGFGLGAAAGGHGKYFQYAHQPEHDLYEFGYRRGNDHHFQERYEKGAPHAGHFKTKVRWGDKHGGYGEHYWDYNHAGHDDGGSGGGGGGGGGGDYGGYSEPIPSYQAAAGTKYTAKRQSDKVTKDDRVKRHPEATPKLVFDAKTGHVYDDASGKVYVLQPVN